MWLYALAGTVPGVLVALLSLAIAPLGFSAGLNVALGVNLIAPGCLLLAAAWYPRPSALPVGVFSAWVCFALVMQVFQNWRFWLWNSSVLELHLVVGSSYVVSGLLGWGLMRVIAPWRQVGWDPVLNCGLCGYPRPHGQAEPEQCPECGV